jgi:hypothetical protein
MVVVSGLAEDDVGDPQRMIMLVKVHPIAFGASARGRSVKRHKEENKDIFASKKGQFPLQKITPDSLSTVMNGSNLIGVDTGLKSN